MTAVEPITVATASSARQAEELITWALHDAGLPKAGDRVHAGTFKVTAEPYDHGKPCSWPEANRLSVLVILPPRRSPGCWNWPT